MKKVIITGATGFIGGALTRYLLGKGVKVIGVDINKERLDEMKMYGDFIPIEAAFTDYANLHTMISEPDIDVFFHFAWSRVFGKALGDYELQLLNTKYACDALMQAKRLGCKKFVFAGTCNEYEVRFLFDSETYQPRYTCVYSTAKMAAELICKTLAYQNDIEYSAGLICMAYGERNGSEMVSNIVIRQLAQGIEPKLIEGNNLYDMIYIDDIVMAFEAIAEKGKNQKSYYVGHRKLKTFREVMTDIRDILNPSVKLNFGAYHDTSNINYDLIELNALYNDTGFECRSNFRESIIKTAQWLKGE